jgi:hypothetical protein
LVTRGYCLIESDLAAMILSKWLSFCRWVKIAPRS